LGASPLLPLLLLLWGLLLLPGRLLTLPPHSSAVGELAQVNSNIVGMLPACTLCLAAVCSCQCCGILQTTCTVDLPQHC
jgi:hypothetical protein